jgi:hypothetical protein
MPREQPAARAWPAARRTRYPAGRPSNRPPSIARCEMRRRPFRPRRRAAVEAAATAPDRPAVTGPAAAPTHAPAAANSAAQPQQKRRTTDPSAIARCWLCPIWPCVDLRQPSMSTPLRCPSPCPAGGPATAPDRDPAMPTAAVTGPVLAAVTGSPDVMTPRGDVKT